MRKPADNCTALATVIAHKAEIDTILARLMALSGEQFDRTPNAVSWGDAGTLGSYLQQLRQVSDAAFHEGEHAD